MSRRNPNRRNTRGNAREDAPPATPPIPNASDTVRQVFIEMMPELVAATIQAMNAAKNYFESQMANPKPKAKHVQTFKRKVFDHPPSRFAEKRSRTDFYDQRNFHQPSTIAAPRGPQQGRTVPGFTIVCSLCKHEHRHGNCYRLTGACFKCGKQGHRSKECPSGQSSVIASTSQDEGKGKMT